VHKTVIIPHDEKKFRGGEDSASTSDHLLVVADGVGGWANKGVNPGHFSRLLTKQIVEKFALNEPEGVHGTDDGEKKKDNNPSYLKELMHSANHYAASKHLGSATCTIVRLLNSNLLETLNVGDSGYSIHRRVTSSDNDSAESSDTTNEGKPILPEEMEVVYASIPGQKGFNFPYQLGGPEHGDVVAEVADGPYTHDLQDQDIIVVFSDGVGDNLHPPQFHECLTAYSWTSRNNRNPSLEVLDQQEYTGHYYEEHELISYSIVADCIARKAYALGKDTTYDSPFAQSAKAYGKRFRGGKHDDITVTVAQVAKARSSTPPTNDDDADDDDDDTGEKQSTSLRYRKADPHYPESIKIYTDQDGPIEELPELPTQQTLLHTLVSALTHPTRDVLETKIDDETDNTETETQTEL